MLNRLHIILLWILLPTLMFAQKQSFVRVNSDTVGAFKKAYIYDMSKIGIKVVPDSSLATNSFRVMGGMRIDTSFRLGVGGKIFLDSAIIAPAGGGANFRIFTSGSVSFAASNQGLRKATTQFYDNVLTDTDNVLIKVEQIDTATNGHPIKKTGIHIIGYHPPDNGGDVSGLLSVETGGGSALSAYRRTDLRPVGFKDYGTSPQGAFEAGTSDYSHAGLFYAGTGGTRGGQAIYARVDNDSSLGIIITPNNSTFDSRHALTVGIRNIGTNVPSNVNWNVAMNGTTQIGTTVADSQLTITQGLHIVRGLRAGGLGIFNDGTVNFQINPAAAITYIGNTTNHPLGLIANNTEVARVSGSNLAIGTPFTADSQFNVTGGEHIRRGSKIDSTLTLPRGAIANGRLSGDATGLASWKASDTVGLGTSLAGKQAFGTYLIPSDSITERTYSNFLYPAKTITHTIAGTSGQIRSSAGAQDHSANTTWTLSIPDTALLSVKPNFTMTTTAKNTTVNTVAQSQDTSAIYFSFTNTSKPLFNMVGITGNGIVQIDSTGSLGLGGATIDSAITTSSIQGVHIGRGLKVDGVTTIATPFTLGSTSVTSTGTQLNYLNAATGTTGTGSIVYSVAPTFNNASATATVLNLSGDATKFSRYSLGRTANEADYGIAASSTQFSTSSIAGDLIIKNIAGNLMMLSGAGAADFYISSTHNVGIGTASPSVMFSVAEKLLINSSGQVTKVNNIATQGPFGVPTIVDTIEQTGLTASVSAANITGTTIAGAYEVDVYGSPTTANGTSTVYIKLTWDNAGKADSTSTFSNASTANYVHKHFYLVNVPTSASSIQYSTVVTGTIGSAVYKFSITCKRDY